MTDTPTDSDSVERIRRYVDWKYTTPETVVLNSDLVRLTAGDLAALLAERDDLKSDLEAAVEFVAMYEKELQIKFDETDDGGYYEALKDVQAVLSVLKETDNG